MEEVKGCFFLHIPMATKHGTFQWPPSMGSSIDHQAKNLLLLLLLPLATKRRSFTLSLKDKLGSWGGIFFFPRKKQFQFNLESVCYDKVLEEGRKDQLWSWREEGE
jgi:hypothetical protein